MALKINGTEPTEIIFNGKSVDAVKYGTTGVWAKKYDLEIQPGNRNSVSVSVTSSPYGHSTGTLASISAKDTITTDDFVDTQAYYGDVVEATFTPTSGNKIWYVHMCGDSYDLNSDTSVTKKTTVTNSGRIYATAIRIVEPPELSGSITEDAEISGYRVSVKINNPNSFPVTAHLADYRNSQVYYETTYSIDSNSSRWYTDTDVGTNGVTIIVYFSDDVYTESLSSEARQVLGSGGGSTGGDESTTTTTA